ncbi:hypothetical protein GCM10018793_67530 [Streptomyces sulfonofaciens]|uniref:Uncharacterized protein n=1 Tax=Streptomyces sulfonofaciens TaxID=68272 RepID=A0A919GPC5_9ACTN|nr:hypothetical protein [Streptomyces sulfonofaciens]GHH88313.1 hypothetical protein GCM10018793_67530 [Streptomyces sulfonofaciens]
MTRQTITYPWRLREIMAARGLRSLSDLHAGARVQATITSHQPWGITATVNGYEPVGASLDVIRRGREPGVSPLAQDLPAVGSTIELVVGEIRQWHKVPWIWVDLTTGSKLNVEWQRVAASGRPVPRTRP